MFYALGLVVKIVVPSKAIKYGTYIEMWFILLQINFIFNDVKNSSLVIVRIIFYRNELYNKFFIRLTI